MPVERLIEARRQRSLLAIPSLPVPASIEAGLKAQAAHSAALGRPIAGWKVMIAPDGTPVAAALHGPFLPQGSTWRATPGADVRIEIELALRLGRDLPRRPGQPYTREEILTACDAVFLGIEIVESRLKDWPGVALPLWTVDHLGHGGYILGQELPASVLDTFGSSRCAITLDGKAIYDAQAVHGNGDPMRPVVAWANRESDALAGLSAGHIITTGSLCGGVPAPHAGKVVAMLSGSVPIAFDLSFAA